MKLLPTVIRDGIRFLFFQAPSSAIREHPNHYLAFGLFFTWLAGMGRYWDNPKAHLIQHLGLGSIIYVFTLALIIWVLLAPLRPDHWSYKNVLLFISLTSPPALLYAIPVERFISMDLAVKLNMWFLGVVAIWRVALFVAFLIRTAKLDAFSVVVGTLTPIVIIVVTLGILNLEHVVFEFMGGMVPEQRSGNDAAYSVVITLSWLSVLASPFLLIAYIVLCLRGWAQAS